MKLFIGKILKPKIQNQEFEETSEIYSYNPRTNKWNVITCDITVWKTLEQIEKEFEEVND